MKHGESDIPHRHDYYTIIFFEKGEGTHIVDFTEYQIEDNTIYFIFPGQMHQVIPTSEPKGWTMKFTDEFLIANSISDKLINGIYLFNEFVNDHFPARAFVTQQVFNGGFRLSKPGGLPDLYQTWEV